jgi:tRNA pseudouridine55 synthase
MIDPRAASRRPCAGGPDGVVLLDKPVGMTSNVALQRVRRLFGARKAGHAGSLDPLASGLLPIFLGQATRFSGYLLNASKSYQVSARLGARTSTGDAEGEVVESCAWASLDAADFTTVLAGFRGAGTQVPPMYSALKQGGERLYRKARRGEVVERAPRAIEIERLELTRWAPPEFSLDVRCSKGTYVRTLIEDIARAAGSCAHVTSLRRYAAGPYSGDDMYSLEELGRRAAEPSQLAAAVLPLDSALAELPCLVVGTEDARRLMHGQVLELPGGEAGGLVRVYGAAGFVGVGERIAEGHVRARRLLATAEALAKT